MKVKTSKPPLIATPKKSPSPLAPPSVTNTVNNNTNQHQNNMYAQNRSPVKSFVAKALATKLNERNPTSKMSQHPANNLSVDGIERLDEHRQHPQHHHLQHLNYNQNSYIDQQYGATIKTEPMDYEAILNNQQNIQQHHLQQQPHPQLQHQQSHEHGESNDYSEDLVSINVNKFEKRK